MTGAATDAPREAPRLSLTFDDGPHPIWTPRVLRALQRAAAHATVFVVGSLVRQFPRLISDILRYGHGVEFHCTEHVRHTEQSRKEVEADVRDGLRELRRQGVHPDSGVRLGACSRPLRRRSPTTLGSRSCSGRRAAKTGGGTRPPRCWNA